MFLWEYNFGKRSEQLKAEVNSTAADVLHYLAMGRVLVVKSVKKWQSSGEKFHFHFSANLMNDKKTRKWKMESLLKMEKFW